MPSCRMQVTQSNFYSWIALCDCGWIGTVHPGGRKREKKGTRDHAREAAVLEYDDHVKAARGAARIH